MRYKYISQRVSKDRHLVHLPRAINITYHIILSRIWKMYRNTLNYKYAIYTESYRTTKFTFVTCNVKVNFTNTNIIPQVVGQDLQ